MATGCCVHTKDIQSLYLEKPLWRGGGLSPWSPLFHHFRLLVSWNDQNRKKNHHDHNINYTVLFPWGVIVRIFVYRMSVPERAFRWCNCSCLWLPPRITWGEFKNYIDIGGPAHCDSDLTGMGQEGWAGTSKQSFLRDEVTRYTTWRENQGFVIYTCLPSVPGENWHKGREITSGPNHVSCSRLSYLTLPF